MTNEQKLVNAAKLCCKTSRAHFEADSNLRRLMEHRYGLHCEMEDDIVETTQYGGDSSMISIEWLDKQMKLIGYEVINR